jgi:spore coat protein CotH
MISGLRTIASLWLVSWAFTLGGQPVTGAGPDFGNFETNLPVMFLEVSARLSHEMKVPFRLKVVHPKGANPPTSGPLPGMLRYHGASSLGYPKKSLSFSLDAPAKLLDLRESPHWVLNAAYIDRSLMRHKLSYDLFRSLSAPGAPRQASGSRFVEVDVNGKYRGVYLLMERVDRQMLGLRAYNSNEVSHACIYKAEDHTSGFETPGHEGFEQREPDPLVRTYWKPMDEFTRFVSSASDEDFFDPEQGIATRLDLDNTIDFHLLILLTQNRDGFDKNFLFSRDAVVAGKPRPRFFFTPWDYDGTFGRDWNSAPLRRMLWFSNHLFDRLLANAGYRATFQARWKQLRQKEFAPKTIQTMIDANATTLGDATRRNTLKWPVQGARYADTAKFEDDISQMKSWVEARVQWLDKEIERRTKP